MYDFINPLTPADFNQRIEFLIDDFLPKKLISMIYAEGGMGKSWIAFGIAKYAAQQAMDVIYLDYDNPISVLKERGIETKLIDAHHNISYSHRSKSKLEPLAILDEFEKMAIGNRYENTLFIIDSIRNFGNIKNDAEAMRVFDKIMNLREAGATIVVLHHSTKNGSNYEGSNNIRNSVDNMFQLIKVEAPQGQIRWLLTVEKERAAITDTALSMDIDDLSLTKLDVDSVRLTKDEKDFIKKVQSAISQHKDINKTALLESCGHKKDDKTARDKLDKFDGTYWQSEKTKGTFVYRLI